MNTSLPAFSPTILRFYIKVAISFGLSLSLFLPVVVRADIVYGTVTGVIPDNLTLIVYKDNKMVSSAAIKPIGNHEYEYSLNLAPGSYRVTNNNVSRQIVNYPGTNRVNINFRQ